MTPSPKNLWARCFNYKVIIALVVAGIVAFVIFPSKAQALLPFLLLLVCPLSMVFMMKGMNHNGCDSKKNKDEGTKEDQSISS